MEGIAELEMGLMGLAEDINDAVPGARQVAVDQPLRGIPHENRPLLISSKIIRIQAIQNLSWITNFAFGASCTILEPLSMACSPGIAIQESHRPQSTR